LRPSICVRTTQVISTSKSSASRYRVGRNVRQIFKTRSEPIERGYERTEKFAFLTSLRFVSLPKRKEIGRFPASDSEEKRVYPIDSKSFSPLVVDRGVASNRMLHSHKPIPKESRCRSRGSPSDTNRVREQNARQLAICQGCGILKNGKTETSF
jgi:hypothetical protein